MNKYYLGIDIGSTTLKAVLMNDNGKVHHTLYERTKPSQTGKVKCTGRCGECGACNLGSLKNTIDTFLDDAGISKNEIERTVVTGSQIIEETKSFVNYDHNISEVSAHVAGARHYYPNCKAILDVGGQDSKAMMFNEDMNMWVSKMSGICAAGTGAFLDSVANKLGVPVEKMAELANYDSDLEFSSICAVLSATSINKFKNRFPLGEIIGGACKAQARTVMSGVGEILLNYKGDIIFQGGVAYNKAVATFLKEITGNNIIIPKFHNVMGALGAACLAKQYANIKNRFVDLNVPFDRSKMKSIAMRAKQTRREFFSKNDKPTVWRNLFFPTEILNAMDVNILTLETYAALFARNSKRIKKAFDNAAYKGFSAETCSFLRVLEGMDLHKPDFAVSTSEPCQQGERVFRDLARTYKFEDNYYSLTTPQEHDEMAIEQIASGLVEVVSRMEKAIGIKMDMGKLKEACRLSNQARELTNKCTELRLTSPPLIPGTIAVYYASIFSQLWGKQELIDLQKQFYSELLERKEEVENVLSIDDTHRIMWLHLPPFYNTQLLEHIEVARKMPIVFEEVNWANWTKLDVEDPYRSLARKLLSVGFLDPQLRVKHIKSVVEKGKFNGCILYNHGFGRCSLADTCFTKHLREELNTVNVPLIVLDGDCMDETTDPCSTATKVSAYSEALNSKKYGNLFGPLSDTPIEKETNNEIISFDSAKKYITKVKDKVKNKVKNKVSSL